MLLFELINQQTGGLLRWSIHQPLWGTTINDYALFYQLKSKAFIETYIACLTTSEAIAIPSSPVAYPLHNRSLGLHIDVLIPGPQIFLRSVIHSGSFPHHLIILLFATLLQDTFTTRSFMVPEHPRHGYASNKLNEPSS